MRVSWLRTALANLDAIGNTFANDIPVAARATVQRIVSAIDALAENPQLDASRPGRIAGTLEVLRVMHARQRWPDRLP